MQHIIRKVSYAAVGCVLLSVMYSCTGNSTAGSGNCADSVRMALAAAGVTTTTTTATTTSDTAGTAANSGASSTTNSTTTKSVTTKMRRRKGSSKEFEFIEFPADPELGGNMHITSSAFTNGGVIPVKYTSDGQGATPPLAFGNQPNGTKSLAVIVHDYHANARGAQTYWLIWNIDSTAGIPENFTNDHEGMNIAKQYGFTPLCGESGDHRYHFMVYALDCKLVIGKNATKASLERVMQGHILDKGELVGIYNKRIE